eukprot:scaffold31783_cov160-Skeletonema_menzelii.AAC.6
MLSTGPLHKSSMRCKFWLNTLSISHSHQLLLLVNFCRDLTLRLYPFVDEAGLSSTAVSIDI